MIYACICILNIQYLCVRLRCLKAGFEAMGVSATHQCRSILRLSIHRSTCMEYVRWTVQEIAALWSWLSS